MRPASGACFVFSPSRSAAKSCTSVGMPSELEALRQEIAALRDAIKPRQSRRSTPQTCLRLRLDRTDYAMMQAEAERRGVTVSDLTREGLASVLPRALRPPAEKPANFRKHRKLDRFDDGKAPVREMAAADIRQDAARRAMQLGLERQRVLREADSALAPATPAMSGKMSDAPSGLVPKLR